MTEDLESLNEISTTFDIFKSKYFNSYILFLSYSSRHWVWENIWYDYVLYFCMKENQGNDCLIVIGECVSMITIIQSASLAWRLYDCSYLSNTVDAWYRLIKKSCKTNSTEGLKGLHELLRTCTYYLTTKGGIF